MPRLRKGCTVSFAQVCFQGSVLIVAVVVLRGLLRRSMPRAVYCILWALVLVRLLLPFGVPLETGPWTWAEELATHARVITDTAASRGSEGVSPPAQTAESVSAGVSEGGAGMAMASSPVPADSQACVSLPPWLRAVRVGVSAVLLVIVCGAYVVSYAVLRMRSHGVETDEARVWLASHKTRRRLRLVRSSCVSVPFTYGVLCPAIVIPSSFTWDDEGRCQLVLEHEYVHVRRFDALFKMLLALGLCVHWFNPLVWLMYALCTRDIELACDEFVTRHLNASGRKAYALTLLESVPERAGVRLVGASFFSSQLKRRVTMILHKKSYAVASAVASVVAIAFVAVVGVTTVGPRSAPALAKEAASQLADGAVPAIQEAGDDLGDAAGMESSGLKPVATMHGTSNLVSEFASDDELVLVTPDYAMVVPQGLLPATYSWEYGEAGSEGTPTGASEVLRLTDASSGQLAMMAYVMTGNDVPSGLTVVASAQVSGRAPSATNVLLAVPSAVAGSLGNQDAPYLSLRGLRTQVFGLAAGQASQEAYVAHAVTEADGTKICLPSCSVHVPKDAFDRLVGVAFLEGSEKSGRTNELMLCFDDAQVSIFEATDTYVEDELTDGDVVVGATPQGNVVVSARGSLADGEQGLPVDANTYAGWVELS